MVCAAAATIVRMLHVRPQLSRQLLLVPLCHPLLVLSKDEACNVDGNTHRAEIGEKALDKLASSNTDGVADNAFAGSSEPVCGDGCCMKTSKIELQSSSSTSTIFVSEKDVEASIQGLHRLFISNAQPGQGAAMSHVREWMPALFHMLCTATRTRSHLKGLIEELVETYLKMAPIESAVTDWTNWVLQHPRRRLCCALGDEGGIVVTTCEEDLSL